MSFFDSDKSKEEKRKADAEFVHDEGELEDGPLVEIHSQLMREQAEPTEQMAPIPMFLLFLFGILLFWGGFYLAKYSGQFRGDVFDHLWVPGGGEAAVAKEFDPLKQGKKLFARTCQQCHQADGMGLPGVYPPLNNSQWLIDDHPDRAVKILLKGMSGPVVVEGKNFNGNMPPVGDWKDRDIAAVLTFVRQNWDNNKGPISEEDVARVREEVKDRKKPWTMDEILSQHPL